MIFAVEKFDERLGTWKPNTFSDTWGVDELGYEITPPTVGIFYTTPNTFDKGMVNIDAPGHECKLLKDIPAGDKYLYLVHMAVSSYFIDNGALRWKCIDPRVVKDCNEGCAAIVILHEFEGQCGWINFLDRDAEILAGWCDEIGLVRTAVHFIHGNLSNVDPFIRHQFNYYGVSVFETWNPSLDIVRNPEKLFVCYNRQPRQHRVHLVSALLTERLDEHGLISFSFRNGHRSHNLTPAQWLPGCQRLLDEGDRVIDVDTTPNLAQNLNKEHYESCFLSLVTETTIDPRLLFITEKTWKPIQCGHPFINFGNPGTLAWLRRQGFKTFGPWWDESYDLDYAPETRIQLILDVLKNLKAMYKNLPHDEIQAVCDFNKQVFKSRLETLFTQDGQFVPRKPTIDILEAIHSKLS